MGRLLSISVLLSLSLVLSACTKSEGTQVVQQNPSQPDDNTGEEEWQKKLERARQRNCDEGDNFLGILGGQKLSSESRLAQSTVFVYSDSGIMCTGTLISRSVVLTAAHCFENEIAPARVAFTTDPVCAIAKGEMQWIKIKKINRNDEYERMETSNMMSETEKFSLQLMSKYDFSLVLLESHAPFPYHAVSIGRPMNEDDEHFSQFYAAGFGKTVGLNEEEHSDPMLRYIPATLRSDFSPDELEKFQEHGMTVADMNLFYFDVQTMGKGICSGDSGGPLYRVLGDRLEVVAVASYVYSNSPWTDPCEFTGVQVKIESQRSWLRRAFDLFQISELNPF